LTLEEFEKLIAPDAQSFYEKHKNCNPSEFSLKYSKLADVPIRAIAEQIYCYQKAKTKLPSFADKLIFEKIALEQSSSEITAKYKSELLKADIIADLTGGFGLDTIFFSQKAKSVYYFEKNILLSNITKLNISNLNIINIKIYSEDSISWLMNNNVKFDLIYLDPARRYKSKRAVDLDFCQPNVYENIDLFLSRSDTLLIKAAPAYDFTEAKRKIKNLSEFIVVSVDNECKEVLLKIEKNYSAEIKIKSASIYSKVNLVSEFESSENTLPNKTVAKTIGNYFFEPDVALIKSGLTAVLADKMKLQYLNNEVDYLTGNSEIVNFIGRKFKIICWENFSLKIFRRYLKKCNLLKANLSKRGFSLSVEELRKKVNIKDGGKDYFFFTTFMEKPIFIHCNKIES